jgi:hypothetical protein
MMQPLRERQTASGAIFTAELDVPFSFGNDAAALTAARDAVALCDRSHWGRIQLSGADRLRFLHNQTTNNLQGLQPGQGCDTVFVTSTGRTIDLVTAYVLEDAVLLLTSPGLEQRLMDWMDRYIFFADRVELKNLTSTTATFSLLGAQADSLLQTLGASEVIGLPDASHRSIALGTIETRIAVGSGLALPGYTLVVNADRAADLWQQLITAGAVPLEEQVWERLRIEQGRPMPDRELTDEFNPLEAGLWHTISLDKGCYIGQETIARLHTYRGVKQQLWGIRLSTAAAPESPVVAGDEKLGKLTSCTATEQGYFGLAYIRTKAAAAKLQVKVADSAGELVPVPFVTHEYL